MLEFGAELPIADRTCNPTAPTNSSPLLDGRILIMDGAMGTMIQTLPAGRGRVTAGRAFAGHDHDVKGDNDLLALTQPDVVRAIHDAYLEAGADIVSSNTFNATSIAQADYGLAAAGGRHQRRRGKARPRVRRRLDRAHARQAALRRRRAGADEPHGVDLARRQRSRCAQCPLRRARRVVRRSDPRSRRRRRRPLPRRDDLRHAERQGRAVRARDRISTASGRRFPVIVSGTITDASGRTLSGQTTEAFWNSVRHVRPLAVGINCSLGAALMRPYIEELARVSPTRTISCYPNAGLPNPMSETGYDETPAADRAR